METWSLYVGVVGLVALLLADLLYSPRYMRRVRRSVDAGDPVARTRMYRLTVALEWSVAGAALALMLAGGTSARAVGLRLPTTDGLARWGGLLAGAAVGGVAMVVLARTGRLPQRVVGDIDVLVPRSRVERRWFAGVAVTAGIAEEVVYRALALTVLTALLPGGRAAALLAAAAAFGLGHAYQGWPGVLGTALLALLLGAMYLDMRSLLPGMVLHAALDLRLLLLAAPAGAPAADQPQPQPQPQLDPLAPSS